jgi:hypothetical protein
MRVSRVKYIYMLFVRVRQAAQAVNNKPYDEAYDVSQDLSMAESFDGRGGDAKVRGSDPSASTHVFYVLCLNFTG